MGITKHTSSCARVSSKGRVVIPVDLRRKYHMASGDEVEIVHYGGVLSSVPREVVADIFCELYNSGSAPCQSHVRSRQTSRPRRRCPALEAVAEQGTVKASVVVLIP